MSRVVVSCCAIVAAFAAAGSYASTNSVSVDAGADLRIRQEIMHNITGLPGAPGAMMPRAYKKDINHIRIRPRIWAKAAWDRFTLYGRLVDEVREHIVKNGVPRKYRSYNFPDEVVLDNLYLDARGLYDGFLDFRIGRQDLLENGRSVFGLPRILQDGTAYDGSRSCYVDMIRFTFHTSEESMLDAFALYDNGRSTFRYGNRNSRGRPINAINPGDSPEMDEWGGGLVWHDSLCDRTFPYKIYLIHKHNEAYYAPGHRRMPDKQITTFGVNVAPELNENVSFELDLADQVGTLSDGSKQAGGQMAYAAVEVHRSSAARGIRPFARLSVYYLSGDRRHGRSGNNDTAWDPLWGRSPQDSELFQYGTLYGLGYWSNMAYPKLTIGANIGPRHRVHAYSGPMFAAVQDCAGHADGSDHGMFKGTLSAVRYDFPILLAEKGAQGCDRFEVFGHVMAELFNPGDYYDSSRPAWFLRWELTFAF